MDFYQIWYAYPGSVPGYWGKADIEAVGDNNRLMDHFFFGNVTPLETFLLGRHLADVM